MPKKRQPRSTDLRPQSKPGVVAAYEQSEPECERICNLIETLTAAGETKSNIATALAIDRKTLDRWLVDEDTAKTPALERIRHAYEKGQVYRREQLVAVAVDGLARSAAGAETIKTTIRRNADGEIVSETVEKAQLAPNVLAGQTIVHTQAPDEWRPPSQRVEVTGQVNHVHTASLLDVPGGAFLPGGSTGAIEGPATGGHVCQDAPDGDADAVDGDFIIIEDGVDG